jgi:hypothetical protein
MGILEISQIIFNFTVTAVVVIIGLLAAIIAVQVLLIIVATKRFFEGLHKESVEVYRKVDHILQNLAGLSFFSRIFSKKGKTHSHPEE